jgi:hypothetical protein
MLQTRFWIAVKLALYVLWIGWPLAGILYSHSLLWNVLWWLVFVIFGLSFATLVNLRSSDQAAIFPIFLILAAQGVYFKTLPEGRLWAYVLGAWTLLNLWVAYKMEYDAAYRRLLQLTKPNNGHVRCGTPLINREPDEVLYDWEYLPIEQRPPEAEEQCPERFWYEGHVR